MFVCKRWFHVASDDILWRRVTEQQFGPCKPASNSPEEEDRISWREAFAEQAAKRFKWRKIFVEDNNGASLWDGHGFKSTLFEYCKKKGRRISESYHCLPVVVGVHGVGKTCLLIATTSLEFPTEYVPTVFDGFVGGLESPLAKRGIGWSFWDTLGPGPQNAPRYHRYRNPNLFFSPPPPRNHSQILDVAFI